MVAETVFFLMEGMSVDVHWSTSMHVGVMVSFVVAVHYFFMHRVKIHKYSGHCLILVGRGWFQKLGGGGGIRLQMFVTRVDSFGISDL